MRGDGKVGVGKVEWKAEKGKWFIGGGKRTTVIRPSCEWWERFGCVWGREGGGAGGERRADSCDTSRSSNSDSFSDAASFSSGEETEYS